MSEAPPEDKVCQETAEEEFERFGAMMDLDFTKEHMDDEDRASFEDGKRRFIREVRIGNLVVDEKGQPVYSLKTGEGGHLTFFEPKGAAFMAGDKKKKDHDIEKLHAVAAELTQRPAVMFANMMGRDVKVVYAIVGLYLGG